MTTNMQPSIMPGVPGHGRYLSFAVAPDADPVAVRDAVQALVVDESLTVGIGAPLVALWGASVDGLRAFPAWSGPGVQLPSTQQALWCWLRGDDRGDLVTRGMALARALAPGLELAQVIDGFKHGDAELGRDLTGYEDGTENPEGDEAVAAAFVGDGSALQGSSFVAVQQWVHDLDSFTERSQDEQDNIIGRRKSDNEELGDAPESAHTKRTEQESFEPDAIVLRRSMPFAEADIAGLQFVAFGHSFDAFEAQLGRMMGHEDGITDALFTFSQPVTGEYYWCPPVDGNRLDLGALG